MAKKPTDPCLAQRVRVAKSEDKVQEMEERLPETPPAERARLRAQIKAERTRLIGFRRQLTACEAAH